MSVAVSSEAFTNCLTVRNQSEIDLCGEMEVLEACVLLFSHHSIPLVLPDAPLEEVRLSL